MVAVCLWMRGFRKETQDLFNLKSSVAIWLGHGCVEWLSQEAFSLVFVLVILCSCLISSLCVCVSF